MKNAGLFLGCLLVIAASALQGMAQSRSQVVPEPLKVTTPTINAQRSARVWLSQPLVQVENVSNKPIEYLTIQVALPGVTEPFMLAYGQQPGKPADKNVQALRAGHEGQSQRGPTHLRCDQTKSTQARRSFAERQTSHHQNQWCRIQRRDRMVQRSTTRNGAKQSVALERGPEHDQGL